MDGHDGGDHGGHGGHGDLHGHTDSHHGGVDSHGGHTTIEALFVAYAFGGGGHGDGSHDFGAHVNGAHSHDMHYVHFGMGRQDTKTGRADDPDSDDPGKVRTFVVHVANHGQPDFLTKLQHYALQHDMLRIDQFRPNFDAVENLKYEIADWTALTEPYEGKNMPEGWYPGATGRTRIIRQYFQVGKRPCWWAPRRPPEFDKSAGTFIEITAVQWRYFETADYETKLVMSIGSLPVWDDVTKQWGYKREPFFKAQRAAIKLCQEMFDYLVSCKPTRVAEALRADIRKKYPVIDRPDGVLHATPEDEADIRHGRDGSPEKAPPPPASTPPADDGGGDDGGDGDAAGLIAPESVVGGANADDGEGASKPAAKPAAKTQTVIVELDD